MKRALTTLQPFFSLACVGLVLEPFPCSLQFFSLPYLFPSSIQLGLRTKFWHLVATSTTLRNIPSPCFTLEVNSMRDALVWHQKTWGMIVQPRASGLGIFSINSDKLIELVSLSFVRLRGPTPETAPPTFQPSQGRPSPNAKRAANKAKCNRDKTFGISNSRSHALYVLHSTLLTATEITLG